MQRQRERERQCESGKNRKRGSDGEHNMSLQANAQGTHTATEPSTFCICCAGGRGAFTHTHTHTLFYIFLFSPSMIEWFLTGSRLFLPFIPVTLYVSLSVFYFSIPSLPLLHLVFLSFLVWFSRYKDNLISNTFSLFSLLHFFSSCYISNKLTVPGYVHLVSKVSIDLHDEGVLYVLSLLLSLPNPLFSLLFYLLSLERLMTVISIAPSWPPRLKWGDTLPFKQWVHAHTHKCKQKCPQNYNSKHLFIFFFYFTLKCMP